MAGAPPRGVQNTRRHPTPKCPPTPVERHAWWPGPHRTWASVGVSEERQRRSVADLAHGRPRNPEDGRLHAVGSRCNNPANPLDAVSSVDDSTDDNQLSGLHPTPRTIGHGLLGGQSPHAQRASTRAAITVASRTMVQRRSRFPLSCSRPGRPRTAPRAGHVPGRLRVARGSAVERLRLWRATAGGVQPHALWSLGGAPARDGLGRAVLWLTAFGGVSWRVILRRTCPPAAGG